MLNTTDQGVLESVYRAWIRQETQYLDGGFWTADGALYYRATELGRIDRGHITLFQSASPTVEEANARLGALLERDHLVFDVAPVQVFWIGGASPDTAAHPQPARTEALDRTFPAASPPIPYNRAAVPQEVTPRVQPKGHGARPVDQSKLPGFLRNHPRFRGAGEA